MRPTGHEGVALERAEEIGLVHDVLAEILPVTQVPGVESDEIQRLAKLKKASASALQAATQLSRDPSRPVSDMPVWEVTDPEDAMSAEDIVRYAADAGRNEEQRTHARNMLDELAGYRRPGPFSDPDQ